MNKPVIAIVGRPNVGKSTLFNKLIGKRVSIVDDTPGVTRDPIKEQAFINGMPVMLMDTGGFKLERETGSIEAELDELVVQKTIDTFKKADLILLLFDAEKITGEDEELVALFDDLVELYGNSLYFTCISDYREDAVDVKLGRVERAKDGYLRAMKMVEEYIGQNDDYRRIEMLPGNEESH